MCNEKKVVILFARVTEKDKQTINEIAKDRGENLSDFVRRSVKKELGRMGYLSQSEMKSLGLKRKANG